MNRGLLIRLVVVIVLAGVSTGWAGENKLVLCRQFNPAKEIRQLSCIKPGKTRVWACAKALGSQGGTLMWYRRVGGTYLVIGVVRLQGLGKGWVGGGFVPEGGWHPGDYLVELVPRGGGGALASAALKVMDSCRSGAPALAPAGHGKAHALKPRPSGTQALKLEAEGWRLLAMGRLKQAEEAFRRAIAAGNLTGAVEGLVELRRRRASLGKPRQEKELPRLVNQAVEAMAAGRAEEAVGLLKAAQEIAPDDESVARLLAKARALAERRGKAQLVVHCRPEAEVWLDGRRVGRTPLKLVVTPGRHRVEARAFGAGQYRDVHIPPGATTAVEFTLTGAMLEVVSYPWAEVYLDGKLLGTTPLVAGGLKVGRARVVLVHRGYRRWEKVIELRADRATCVGARLEKEE